ncbi:MAG: mechanosensitive ion channel protein [Gammaproteobacteria bacterium]|nr:MAG: mechanosensitive ion channel protein [Gammaproteobacteria bacterium]
MDDLASKFEKFTDLTISYGSQFLLAVLVLVIGLWIIKRVIKALSKQTSTSVADETLAKFIASGVDVLLKVLLVISVASMVGIETTSFIAILGAAGLAVGLALQGSLSNFAGGVMILIFRPFKVSDYVEAQGLEGIVKNIGIFVTTLETFDKRILILPNGPLANGNIINHTANDIRAVEVSVGIAYSDDIYKAKAALEAVLAEHSLILQGESNIVAVTDLGESSVDFLVRGFVKTENYWTYFFEIRPLLKAAIEASGCSIPFPQRDVHLYKK